MTGRFRMLAAGLATIGVLGLAGLVAAGPPEGAGAAPTVVVRRVPPNFGPLGLTPDQKEQVYAIRTRYRAHVEDLKRQIVEAQAAEIAECEAVLNASQRRQLALARSAGGSKKAGVAAPMDDIPNTHPESAAKPPANAIKPVRVAPASRPIPTAPLVADALRARASAT